MKAIIIDRNYKKGQFEYLSPYSKITTEFMNKPLLVHHLDALKDWGVEEVVLLSNSAIPESLKCGARWGLDLQVHKHMSSKSLRLNSNDSPILVIPGNNLHSFDYASFLDYHLNGPFPVSRVEYRETRKAGLYFSPFLINSKVIDTLFKGVPYLNGEDLLTVLSSIAGKNTFSDNTQHVEAINTHAKYWNYHKHQFSCGVNTDTLNGFPSNSMLWTDVDAQIHTTVGAKGMVVLGRNSRIGKNVRLSGMVLIGDNTVIGEDTNLENTIVLKDSWVGSGLHLKNALVNKGMLYRSDLNVTLIVEDRHILGDTKLLSKIQPKTRPNYSIQRHWTVMGH